MYRKYQNKPENPTVRIYGIHVLTCSERVIYNKTIKGYMNINGARTLFFFLKINLINLERVNQLALNEQTSELSLPTSTYSASTCYVRE